MKKGIGHPSYRSFILLSLLVLSLVSAFAPSLMLAQDNYPLPPGEPDTWKIPGREERIVPQQAPTDDNGIPIAPSPMYNDDQDRPLTPSGEATEQFSGTRASGAYPGSGMTESGTQPRR